MMSIRRYASITLSVLVLDGSLSPANAQRAILLLRHAERVEYESPDGVLSETGEARARVLARLLQDAGVTAIYASDRKRTQQTAEPLAKALGIAPTTVAAQSQIEATLSLIREREKSGIVVIVSHSDIVPGFQGARSPGSDHDRTTRTRRHLRHRSGAGRSANGRSSELLNDCDQPLQTPRLVTTPQPEGFDIAI